MTILETLDNRTLLIYLLSTETPFIIENGYIKANISLFVDDDFLNNEKIKINSFSEMSSENDKEDIIRLSNEILENVKNIIS
jgi:hypothetical protein